MKPHPDLCRIFFRGNSMFEGQKRSKILGTCRAYVLARRGACYQTCLRSEIVCLDLAISSLHHHTHGYNQRSGDNRHQIWVSTSLDTESLQEHKNKPKKMLVFVWFVSASLTKGERVRRSAVARWLNSECRGSHAELTWTMWNGKQRIKGDWRWLMRNGSWLMQASGWM